MKLDLSTVSSGFLSNTTMTLNFTNIENEFQNKVLYRDNPDGEPNAMQQDLDMNGHSILNALATSGEGFSWEGTWVTGTSYILNNLVYVNEGTYIGHTMIALSSFTSTTTFDADYALGRWAILAARGASGAGTGDMLKTENLSGLANTATARTNLGCATLAGSSAQAFAVLDDAYAVGWNGSSNVPTKNAVYDKIETLAAKGTNSDITSLTALTNITASAVTVATDDKILIRDTSDSDNIKTVTAQSIADLAGSGSGVTLLKYTEITATNATWAKQAGTTAIEVLCVGGGAAGGGCTANQVASGGQAGEQVRGYLDTGLTSTFVATIGAGGTGVSGGVGNNGGTTSFTTSTPTTIASALGGLGGELLGTVSTAASGLQGQSGVKRGGVAGSNVSGSAAGANSGAGGGGSSSTAGAVTGGNGGSGIIYVWEYG